MFSDSFVPQWKHKASSGPPCRKKERIVSVGKLSTSDSFSIFSLYDDVEPTFWSLSACFASAVRFPVEIQSESLICEYLFSLQLLAKPSPDLKTNIISSELVPAIVEYVVGKTESSPIITY